MVLVAASRRSGNSGCFSVAISISEIHANLTNIELRELPEKPFLARRSNFALLGYLWPPCNCLWAFLGLLGAVLGIHFSRFFSWERSSLFSRYCKFDSGAERDRVLAQFKNATSTLSAKLKTLSAKVNSGGQ
jgi:hypothetical protein